MNNETVFLGSKDVAYILDISPNDVIDLVHKQRLEATKKGKYWRFRLQDVMAYKRSKGALNIAPRRKHA